MGNSYKKLTSNEIEILKQVAEHAIAYEKKEGHVPITEIATKEANSDKAKIIELLGYEPDLIELVEFKMYQMKIKQNALAELLGIPTSKVSQILNKKREPDVAFLKGIHEKLSIDGNYILEIV